MKIRNIFIIFFISGLWHGANWTFVVWGLLNGIYMLPSIIFKSSRKNHEIVAKGKLFPTLRDFINISATFGLTLFAWIFFRAESVSRAFDYISGIFSSSLLTLPHFENAIKAISILFITSIFFIVEWLGREQQYALARAGFKLYRPFRWAMYFAIILAIFWLGGKQQEFIYYQF